jgi:subtilisin family serine protease
MKNFMFLVVALFMSLTSLSQSTADGLKNQILISVDKSRESELKTIMSKNDMVLLDSYSELGWILCKIPEGMDFEKAVRILSPYSKKVYRDEIMTYGLDYIPNDPEFALCWHLKQSNDKDIDADEAWDLLNNQNPYVTVAMLDGGLEITHPDLVGNWNTPFNATNSTNSAAFVNQFDKHGTACSGTIAAVTNNSVGVSSIGNNKVQVMPINIMTIVSSSGSFNTSASIQINAINAAMSNPTCVAIAMSYSGSSYSQALNDAFNIAKTQGRGGKGILLFASSGNNSSGTATNYPANYPAVWGVGATSASDLRSSFSNFGNICEISAPGSSIRTTDRLGINGYNSTDYTSISGTSFSCPITAAAASLIAYKNYELTADQILSILSQSAEKVGGYTYSNNPAFPLSTRSNELGYGRINIKNAILITPEPGGTPPPPPNLKHNFYISSLNVLPSTVNLNLPITANCTVSTQNPELASVNVITEFRLSNDNIWGNSDDVIIGTDTSSLGGGIANSNETISYFAPNTPGTKYILAKTNTNLLDESFYGDNNGQASFLVVDPLVALTDLSIEFVSPATSPFNTTSASVNLKWKVTNTGSAVVTSFIYSRGWVNCPNGAINCATSVNWTGNLQPGQSVFLPGTNSWISVQLCSSFPSIGCAIPLGGSNTYRAVINQANGFTNDSNLSNNTALCEINRLSTSSVESDNGIQYIEIYNLRNITEKPKRYFREEDVNLGIGFYAIHTVFKNGGINIEKIIITE